MIYSCRISTHTFLMTLYDCANPSTAIPIIIEARFQAFQRFSSRKLVLKAVESCFVALNYYGNGSTFLDIQIQNHCTAECRIIVSRYSGFNGFPVVNWYKKPLKAVEPLSIILQVAVLPSQNHLSLWKFYDVDSFRQKSDAGGQLDKIECPGI